MKFYWDIHRDDPYPTLTAIEVSMRVVYENLTPETPSKMSLEMEKIFRSCFAYDPNARPTFQMISKQLSGVPFCKV